MPPSHLTKFVATYATAFWRKAGLSGDMGRNSCEGLCESNPIAITFDATTNNGNPAILGFITSYAAAKWTSVVVSSFCYHLISSQHSVEVIILSVRLAYMFTRELDLCPCGYITVIIYNKWHYLDGM